MNRITKIIHRVKFNTRQRRTVNHYKKFVISRDDLKREKERKERNKNVEKVIDIIGENRKLLKHFEPEDNWWDRRALFEVTGIRLEENDFLESDTSDEEVVAQNREARRQNKLKWLKYGS